MTDEVGVTTSTSTLTPIAQRMGITPEQLSAITARVAALETKFATVQAANTQLVAKLRRKIA